MSPLPGVFYAKKKDGSAYYRSSVTYRSKHISLGSYDTEEKANLAYLNALQVINDKELQIIDYTTHDYILDFFKWVSLINYRDYGIYIKTPVYMKQNYFLYYLSPHDILKFDIDDLFYYSHHKIMKRGGHLFVADYGMQVNIQSRYGIKNFAVKGRDYQFRNGDPLDYRYGNVEIINRYYGVQKKEHGLYYEAKIHINGDYLIGRYPTEAEAAAAYNKTVMLLSEKNHQKNYTLNYIEDLDEIQYASLLNKVRISDKLRKLSAKTV